MKQRASAFVVVLCMSALVAVGCRDVATDTQKAPGEVASTVATDLVPARGVAGAESSLVQDAGGAVGPAHAPTAPRFPAQSEARHLADAASRMQWVLPAERRAFDGKALSLKKASDLLTSDRFDEFSRLLAEQSLGDPLARDNTEIHRTMLVERLQEVGPLAGIACGHGICAGSIDVGRNRDAYNRFVADFVGDDSLQVGNVLEYPMTLPNGETQARFILSIHPSFDGLSVKGTMPPGE